MSSSITIYKIFHISDIYGSIDSNYNTHLSEKYKENIEKDLKRNLKDLKRYGGRYQVSLEKAAGLIEK